ncbi:MAG: 4a-hydroxytetrahydrobiopterin dehydratase [Hyphomicrobiales bacterium]|nr:4a-hydroxytetrahydrobiopterin dehydratase [Hyphomicrobiales bacterium]
MENLRLAKHVSDCAAPASIFACRQFAASRRPSSRGELFCGGPPVTGASKKTETVYSAEEIEKRLPRHWRYEDGWIKRTYRTHSWKGTMLMVGTIGHLAEAAWHHPDITLSYAWLEVRLQTHSAKGVTDKDFALARKIEETLSWRPGREGAGLEGTPQNDARFSYIKYDD